MSNTQIGVYIGRFQPLHTGHLAIIKQGIQNEDKFIIIIGSIDKHDSKNPYSFEERTDFIRGCLSNEENSKLIIKGLRDSTQEDRDSDPVWWYTQVKHILSDFQNSIVSLYGSNKDSITEDYLNKLKTYSGFNKEKIVEPILTKDVTINATDIRTILNKTEKSEDDNKYLRSVLPEYVLNKLKE